MKPLINEYYQGDARLLVRPDWCKGCNICIEACPVDILELDGTDRIFVTDINKCIFCGICAVRCPDFCISLEHSPSKTAGQYEQP